MPNDFKKLVTARLLFHFASEVLAVILGWRVYELTHDPLSLGLIGLSEAIPALGIALYAGVLVDHSRPLFIYRCVFLGNLVSAAVVLLSQVPAFDLTATTQVGLLYLASFLAGVARSFAQPAVYAVIPRILPRRSLSRGAAWSTMALQVARIVGPATGGILFGFTGMLVTAGVACALLLLATSALLLIAAVIPAPQLVGERNIKEDLFSGASFVFKHPILLPALSLDMISVFFGGVTALLPIFASDILMIGPKGLGALRAAPAIGAAVTSFWLMRVSLRARAGNLLLVCVAGFSVSILVFGVSTSFYLSLFALGASGAFDSISMVIRGTAVQLASPEAMRGRISAVNSIFIGSSNELGEFESGVAARLFGTVPAVVLGGLVSFLTVVVVYFTCPALRDLDLDKLRNE